MKQNGVWGKKYFYKINLYCILLIFNLYFRYSYNIQRLKSWNILSKHKELENSFFVFWEETSLASFHPVYFQLHSQGSYGYKSTKLHLNEMYFLPSPSIQLIMCVQFPFLRVTPLHEGFHYMWTTEMKSIMCQY